MANENGVQESVAPVPKLFVGQVPMDCTSEQLGAVMQQYGEAKVSLLKGPKRQNSPQTSFAMVTFDKWASAEKCVEALHGKCTFGSKPLVVRFADPPKGDDSKGIIPKKLFVGQIPKECSESQVRSWFEPYGPIVSLVVKRNAVAANISFVVFSTWAAAEEAVAAMHGTRPVESAANPLVVKFADGKGKPADAMGVGVKRGNDADSAGLNKRANHGMGSMAGIRGGGMGMPGGMMAGGYGGPHAYAMMGGMPGGMQGRMAMWGADVSHAADGMQGAEMNQMGGMHMGMAGGMGRMGGGMNPEMALSMGGMHGGAMGGMQGMGVGMGGMPMNGMQMNGMYQDEMGMRGGYGGQDATTGAMGMGMGMPMGGAYGAMPMAGGENGMAGAHMNGGGAESAATATARTCPWKLFVGQLPYTAGEEDLMALFGSFGDILECKVLRKSGSMESKGCGFVTFSAAEHAAMAISALNQQAAIPGHARRLIVHYAK